MGRPKEYDERTQIALREAAERVVADGGPDALSLRTVAHEAGTTTQAVYTLFGSKAGLVAALAEQAFEQLIAELDRLPQSDDPVADLIDAGAKAFRGFVKKHPSLYRVAFQRLVPGLVAEPGLTRARERALAMLHGRVQRVHDEGILGAMSVQQAALEFHAMCEGLANVELRGAVLPILPRGREARAWHDALSSLVRGFGSDRSTQRSERRNRPSRRRST